MSNPVLRCGATGFRYNVGIWRVGLESIQSILDRAYREINKCLQAQDYLSVKKAFLIIKNITRIYRE